MTAYTVSLTDSLATYDSYSAVMPTWFGTMSEVMTTDDTFSHQFTAVRPLIDRTGAASLGRIGLPLLFTIPSGIDVNHRNLIGYRSMSETLAGSDSLVDIQHMVGIISESLTTSDDPEIQQTLGRKLTDSIPYVGETITKHFRASRLMKEQAGTDLLVSPMLLFPIPRNDVLTRVSGHTRGFIDTTHVSDSLKRVPGFRRSPTDTTGHTDVLGRLLHQRRIPIETLAPSQTLSRVLHSVRISRENIPTVDPTVRLIVVTRHPIETLTTSDHYSGFSNKPRNLIETQVTHEILSTVQLLQAIMGYIWVAANGNVVADLPDWGWVLVEDPTLGNSMSVVPIPAVTLDPTREK